MDLKKLIGKDIPAEMVRRLREQSGDSLPDWAYTVIYETYKEFEACLELDRINIQTPVRLSDDETEALNNALGQWRREQVVERTLPLLNALAGERIKYIQLKKERGD